MEPVLEATSDLSSAALSVTLMCAPAEILQLTLSQLRANYIFFSRLDLGQMVGIFDGADNQGASDPKSAFSRTPVSWIKSPQLCVEQSVNDLCCKEPYCNL